jgi:alcohol oxidase
VLNRGIDVAGTHSLTSHSGGTAACVAAGRLARADPNLSILLVEGGPNNHNDPTITNPAMYLVHLLPTSKTTLFYEANAEEALNGRKAVVPAGGCLGGGSSINFMMYTRAQGCDFDDWDTKGWTAKDLLPLMKRVRNDRSYLLLSRTKTDR